MFFKRPNLSITCAYCEVEFTPVNPRRLCCTEVCTKKRDDRKHYLRHSEKIKARSAAYRASNQEYYKHYNSAYRKNPTNNKRIRELRRKWEKANPESKRKNTADYRAKKDSRTPKWLTKNHHAQIKQAYKLAQQLQNKTGIRYSVDHIVPLRAKNVCGLHVPWNLQVIPLLENCKKRNTYEQA